VLLHAAPAFNGGARVCCADGGALTTGYLHQKRRVDAGSCYCVVHLRGRMHEISQAQELLTHAHAKSTNGIIPACFVDEDLNVLVGKRLITVH
jgi:hypothetical protein